MRGKKAKRLRRNTKAVLGIDSIPPGNRYQLKNPRYVQVPDPDMNGEIVDELYSATYVLHPEEPRSVYQRYKTIVQRSGAHE